MKNSVIITGGSLNGNSGAEAMLVTTIKRIKELVPDSEFSIFTPYPKDDLLIWKEHKDIELVDSSPLAIVFLIIPLSIIASFFKLLKLNFLKNIFPKPIKILWDSKLMIDVAGVSFIDSRIKFLPFNVLSVYPAFLFKVPLVKFAQAVGPFEKKINRILATHCFKKSEYIFARGDKTLEHLETLKLNNNKYGLASDIVFNHKVGDSITDENNIKIQSFIKENTSSSPYKKKIGICPSSVLANSQNGDDYFKTILQILKDLVRLDYQIIVFPNATKEHKETWRNNDIPLINELKEEFNCESIHYLNYNLNSDGVKKIIQILDVVIVSRFHAMVFALSLQKPVSVIGWSHKYKEVMKQLGLDNYVLDFENTEYKHTIELINKMIQQQEEIENIISEKLPEIEASSFIQIKKAASILNRN